MKAEIYVVHWSATNYGNAALITHMHLARGWGQEFSPGYHRIILNGFIGAYSQYVPRLDGVIETGQPFDNDLEISYSEMGAHTLGLNEKAIGSCLIGSPERPPSHAQLRALYEDIQYFRQMIPNLKVIPHSDVNATECPGDKVRGYIYEKGLWVPNK